MSDQKIEVHRANIDGEAVNVVAENDHVQAVTILEARVDELRQYNASKKGRIEALQEEVQALKDDHDQVYSDQSTEIRDGIIRWAAEHELDIEFINGLLEGYLNMQPAPSAVTAEFEVTVAVTFDASAGVPVNIDPEWLSREVSLHVEPRPAWTTGLEVDAVALRSKRVTDIETI